MMHHVRRIPRNAALLIALLSLIVLAPMLPPDRSWFVVELLFGFILISGVHSTGPFKHRWAFVILTVVTLAVRWAELLSGALVMDVPAHAITIVWMAFAVAIIVGHLFQHRDVDINTILGAVVTYLLAAVAFAIVFQMVELLTPGAFSGIADTAGDHREDLASAMMYYSLVCITTMGYGDVVPVGALARPLSVLEGVFGQLYLAVMIARLVGLHIARESFRDD
jgi:hypothetical protein